MKLSIKITLVQSTRESNFTVSSLVTNIKINHICHTLRKNLDCCLGSLWLLRMHVVFYLTLHVLEYFVIAVRGLRLRFQGPRSPPHKPDRPQKQLHPFSSQDSQRLRRQRGKTLHAKLVTTKWPSRVELQVQTTPAL